MIRLFRLLGRLGLRWMVVGAVARVAGRYVGRSTVERAGRDLEAKAQDRLPAPMARAVSALPPEALQVGGTAVVAGRAAKGAVTTTRQAGRLARTGTQRATAGISAARSVLDQVRSETEASTRRLRARYLDAALGSEAATDSLLDRRAAPRPELDVWADPHDIDPHDADPHNTVPAPVAPGRRRSRRRPRKLAERVRRSYRPTEKPWHH